MIVAHKHNGNPGGCSEQDLLHMLLLAAGARAGVRGLRWWQEAQVEGCWQSGASGAVGVSTEVKNLDQWVYCFKMNPAGPLL